MTTYRLIRNVIDSDMIEAYYVDEKRNKPTKYLAFILPVDFVDSEINDILDEDSSVDVEFSVKYVER
ncbi:MAG: hypothetical protein U9R43_18345 [Thermodesulfobacteriota bacterium]|nr:hypothetical protein [Thermodesulfobacteriota bacterium]